MKLTTITVPAVEMTREEFRKWWDGYRNGSLQIEGKTVVAWHTDDGDNCLLLEGETRFRAVVIK